MAAGMWHRVECVEDSTSINVSLMGASWADVVTDALRQRLLCMPEARAPICMRSVQDGRSQLAAVLDTLRAEVDALAPETLLPASVALPRVVRRRLSATGAPRREAGPAAHTDVDSPPIKRGTGFRRSPLAVLVKQPARLADEGALEEEGEEEEEEDEEDGEEEGGPAESGMAEAEEDAADGLMLANGDPSLATRCGGEGRLAGPSDLFVDSCAKEGGDEDDDAVTYVLHSHFGGEELQSLLRVELIVPPRFLHLAEWLRLAPPTFTAAEAWRAAMEQGDEVPFEAVAGILRELERDGFCARERKSRRPS